MSQVITAWIWWCTGRARQGQGFHALPNWARLTILGLLLATACDVSVQRGGEAALPLADALPTPWAPLGQVQEVNVDGDVAPEYLLLFAYNVTTEAATAPTLFFQNPPPSGPIGAVIYDTQVVTGTTAASGSVPPSTNAFIAYPLLPSYRQGAGQGFIAEPPQRDEIAVYAVNYGQQTGSGTASADTLMLRGGETRLTFARWQNRTAGYDVTQLMAPGGFEAALYVPFDWTAWERDPQPIRQIIGRHPLHDRNLLCRRFRYQVDTAPGASVAMTPPTVNVTPTATTTTVTTVITVTEETPPPPTIAPLHFLETDLGLQFCYGTPDHPFYPEGVVLAYLLTGDEALLDREATPTTAQTETSNGLRQLIESGAVARIDDLVSYVTLAAVPTGAVTVPPESTVVCATIAQQSAEALDQQTMLFTLRYQPPQAQARAPERFFITNVEMLAAPNTGVVVNCRELLGG
ncbi:MAG: hypothetical protein R3E79_16980 [Caldilineaceae bacterium]